MRVLKIGGSIVDHDERLAMVIDACSAFGEPFVLVHGGGKMATEMADRLGVPTTMEGGRRVTDAETLRIVTMVYGGLVNKNIVAKMQGRGVNAVGITGADGNVVRAHKRVRGTLDFGHVGDIDSVDTALLHLLMNSGYSVVCAPLSHDGAGSLLNTNADTIAAELAIALRRAQNVELVYVFEHAGVLRDVNDPSSMMTSITRTETAALLESGTITAGMMPKLTNAFMAIERGVTSVRITRFDMLDAGTLIR